MTKIRNLSSPDSNARKDEWRLRRMERATSLFATSVSDGQTKFNGNESLLVEGSQKVTGWLIVTGILKVVGTFLLEGITTITGALEVIGSTRLRGVTTLENDLTVTNAGKIKVGTAMTFDPTVSAGAIVFGNGAQVFTDSTTVQVYKGNGVAQISNTEAKLQLGGKTVRLSAAGIEMYGLGTKTGTGLLPGLLWRDPATGLVHVIMS